MIHFRCTSCRKKHKAEDSQGGVRFRCSRCGVVGAVPEHSQKDTPVDEEPPISFRREPDVGEDLDMTPMVDVTFLLLIFFMITATFASQQSLEIPAPDAQQSVSQDRTLEDVEDDDDYIIVRIDADDVVWVNNEDEAPTRQELLSKLREARETGSRPPSNLLVLASGDARHETVVMVLDVGNSLGIEHIRLSSDEGDE